MLSTLRREWYVIVIVTIPFVLSWTVRDVLPDQVPIHFNFKGEADDWGPKWVNAIALPLLGIGLYLQLVAVRSIDPKNKIENKPNYFRGVRTPWTLESEEV